MKRWPNVVWPVSMPSIANFTTSGSSVSRPKVAVIACSGRTQESAPGLADRAPQRIDFGKHVKRGAAWLFDQRDVKVALLRIALDLRFVERGKSGGFKKARNRSFGPADARTFAFFLQISLSRRDAMHGQRQTPRRRKRFRALINKAFGDELVSDHAAQIVCRLGLHARGDFLGKQFEQEIG